jgi:serine/threonine protein kinase
MDEQQRNSNAPEHVASASDESVTTPTNGPPTDNLLHLEGVQASDEAPTVITRAVHASLRTEDALGVVVRGRRLAHFELLEPIGVGGMAAVIRARDTQLDRDVALKILPPETAGDPESIRRFQHEARAAAKLDHENIARVFFCGEDQGLYFIAFEFVKGQTLRAIVEKEGRLSVARAIGYMLQIASGLAHAATRGVVHRDIKPSNIIITPNGRAKLVDMGLARSLEMQTDGALTKSGVTLGTFDYISPEQALEPREADIRSDIYSLGCTSYHMLTGQPPVPEGTAAKKLHHQQYVPPIDPRQLNRDIPDEIAALLARMMAKDPADRFQDPEELVNHLLVLARKYADAGEPSDSVLLVDANLPDPPRIRPLLFAVSAVLALVILVVVLSPPASWPLTAPNSGSTSSNRVSADPDEGPSRAPDENAEPPKNPAAAVSRAEGTTPSIFEPNSERELADFLRKSDSSATVYLAHDLTLSRDDQLVFHGQELIIRGKDPNFPPTIRLKYDGSPSSQPWAALTIKSGKVRIEDVHFVIDAREASELTMASVAVEGGQVYLKRCEFVQEYPPTGREGHVSSVSILSPSIRSERPYVELIECFFAEGQHAVTLTGPANAKLVHCACAAQTLSLFDIERSDSTDGTMSATVNLANVSSFVLDGSIFRLEPGAVCRLETETCVFSRPDLSPAGKGATLIEQVGNRSFDLDYRGFNNCYHNLKNLWQRDSSEGAKESAEDLESFRRRVGVQDERSFVSLSSPWESSEPIPALMNRQLRRAFRLNTTVAELRQPKNPTQMIGVETCVWGSSYDKLAALLPSPPTEAAPRNTDRVVDPRILVQFGNTYQTLRQALEAAIPGDSILIKHNGPLKVDPVRFEKAGSDITIRPYPGCQPVLSIGETTEPDAALFRVYDGRLNLERLEFHLQPRQSEFKAQAVVAIMGDGQCTFKNCLATLEETREIPVSVVTLADPTSVMKMNPQVATQQDPRIELDSCFVRGAGDLVTVGASRAFDLVVENSLIVLDGSLLVAKGNPNPKDTSARVRSATLSLNRVTTYLTDHLVWLRARRQDGMSSKGLVPTQVRSATNCLFVSANGKSLIHLDDVDNDDQMKRVFGWGDSRHNAYSNFTTWLDQKPWAESESMAPLPYGKSQWESFAQESDSRFERVRFGNPLSPEVPLSRAGAENFKVTAEGGGQGYGGEIDRLPKPYEEIESGR